MCCDTLLGLICNAAKSHLKKGPDLETLANSLGIYRNSHGMFQEKFMRPLKFLSAKLQYVFRSPVSDELLPKLKQKVFVAWKLHKGSINWNEAELTVIINYRYLYFNSPYSLQSF